jgi:hypothetical protein
VIGSLAALALAILVTLITLRDDDGDGDRVTAGSTTSSSTTSTSTSTSTTTTTAPSTTSSPTTAAPATTATPTTVVFPVVTGQGAVLRPPATAETRTVPLNTGCEGLGDPGWTVACGTANARGGVLAWVVESMSTAGGETARRAMVFRRGAGGQQWSLVLQASDDSGAQFTAIRARVEDLSGDGPSEIAFGFTRVGASGVLAVDVVEGPGNLVVHRELPRGVARVSSGQLDTWRRSSSTQYAHEVIQFRDNAWRIVASASVPASDVPPSQL